MYITSCRVIINAVLIAALAGSSILYVPSGTARTCGPASFEFQEGKAMGKMPLGLPLGNKHQRLKTIIPPMPEVWLAYYKPSSGVQGGELPTVVVQLPQKAKKILWDQWRVAWPKYSKYYRAAPVKRNRDALVDLMVELSSASDWAIQKLVRVNINAPDGRRPITQNEAMDLVRLVNTFARDSVAPEKDKMTAQARWSAFEQRHLTTH